MKGIKIKFYLSFLIALLSCTNLSAGDLMDFGFLGYGYGEEDTKTYYKNLSLTIHNPESAKGRVYLSPFYQDDAKYCKVTNEPKIAKIEGNLADNYGDFMVRLFVLPADGYVLDCLSWPDAYKTGDYKAEYLGSEDGYPYTSLNLILDDDTTKNCTTQRPEAGRFPTPVSKEEFYAVFIPATKMAVHNKQAGQLSDIVKTGTYGESVNDLVVSGPLNRQDFKYLNNLSKNKGLVRLDLSGASFKILPDSAFYRSKLYELKLPQTIDSVGNYAFAYSYGLKPVKLPERVKKGKYIFSACNLISMIENKYISIDPSNGVIQNGTASSSNSAVTPTPSPRKGPNGKDLPDDLAFISEKMDVISAGALKNRGLRQHKPEYGLRYSGGSSKSTETKLISSLATAPCPVPNVGWSSISSIDGLANTLIADGCPFEGAYKGDYISGYKMTEIIIDRGGRILPEIDFGGGKGYWEYADVVADINHRDDKTQDKPYFTFNCAINMASTSLSNPANAEDAIKKSFISLKDELLAKGYELQNPSSPTFFTCKKGGIRIKMELFFDQTAPLNSHAKITVYNFKK